MGETQIYKQRKEDHVSNLTGTSVQEVLAVVLILPITIWLHYIVLCTLKRKNIKVGSYSDLFLEYVCYIVPCVFSVTILADYVTYAVSACFVLIVAFQLMSRCCYDAFSLQTFHQEEVFAIRKAVISRRPRFVSIFRAGVTLLTCVCILAVDFDIFPRRFAKAETYGFGVMDLGVGTCILSMGLTSPLSRPLLVDVQKQNTHKKSKKYPLLSANFVMIVALGFARTLAVKSFDYQEHVTEYGVHWNFFFTLAVLSLVNQLLLKLRQSRLPYLNTSSGLYLISGSLIIFYEVCTKPEKGKLL